MDLTADRIRDALATCHGELLLRFPMDLSRSRPAGVVVPLVLSPEPTALLVLRAAHLNDHAGEVAFPGGKPEPTDADLRATALRELGEEIAVGADEVEWLGLLPACPVITGRYVIHPFVAAVRDGARPREASREIERVLALPLLPLLTGKAPFYAVKEQWKGVEVITPHFRIGKSTLYGASAVIFHELLLRLGAELGIALPEAIIEETLPWGDRYLRT